MRTINFRMLPRGRGVNQAVEVPEMYKSDPALETIVGHIEAFYKQYYEDDIVDSYHSDPAPEGWHASYRGSAGKISTVKIQIGSYFQFSGTPCRNFRVFIHPSGWAGGEKVSREHEREYLKYLQEQRGLGNL